MSDVFSSKAARFIKSVDYESRVAEQIAAPTFERGARDPIETAREGNARSAVMHALSILPLAGILAGAVTADHGLEFGKKTSAASGMGTMAANLMEVGAFFLAPELVLPIWGANAVVHILGGGKDLADMMLLGALQSRAE